MSRFIKKHFSNVVLAGVFLVFISLFVLTTGHSNGPIFYTNVGIGVTNPVRKLEVVSSADLVALFTSLDRYAGIGFEDDTTTGDTKVRIGADGDDLRMLAGGTERMRIDSSGNVNILAHDGTTKGLKLNNDLVELTAAQINSIPGSISSLQSQIMELQSALTDGLAALDLKIRSTTQPLNFILTAIANANTEEIQGEPVFVNIAEGAQAPWVLAWEEEE